MNQIEDEDEPFEVAFDNERVLDELLFYVII